MADLSKLRFNGTDYNVKDASAPTRKFNNAYSKTGNLPISSDDTTQTAIGKLENNIIPKSAKGTANGVAELDANGKVPSSQLPSYVDDVLEYSAKSSFPATGESGKIYVDTTTNKTYRWSGSAYVEISESLALGETDSTAYRGDRGKAAYDHSQLTSGNPHNVTKSDVGLGNVGNFKAVSTAASQGLSNTEKANARSNIGAGTGNGTYSKPTGGIPKSDLASAVQTTLDQVATNQTNILYAIDTGVKNWFVVPDGTYSSNSAANSSVCSVENGVVKIITCSTADTRVMTLGTITLPAGTYKLSNYILGGSFNYGDVRLMNPDGSRLSPTGDGVFTIAAETIATVKVYTWNASVLNASVSPFLCVKSIYDQDSSYAKPALPNYDLTYLQAEDRAALAEVVDSGAKNLFSDNNVSDVIGVTWNSSTGTATQSSTDTQPNLRLKLQCRNGSSGNFTELFNNQVITSNGVASFEFTCPTTATQLRFGHNGSQADATMVLTGFNLQANTKYYIQCNVINCVQASGAYSWNKIMVCTKAAFGVSQKFVPYRGTFGNKAVGTVDMNSLTVEGNYYVSNATKATHHAPKDGYFFVDVYTTENGEKWQKAYRINEPQYIYQRQMTSNTWGTWYIFTGTAVS